MQCTATHLRTPGWHGFSGTTGEATVWVCQEGTGGTVCGPEMGQERVWRLEPKGSGQGRGAQAEGGGAGVPRMPP